MDNLQSRMKTIFPDEADDDLDETISLVKKHSPGLSEDQIVQIASKVKEQGGGAQAEPVSSNPSVDVNNYIKEKYGVGERQRIVDENEQDASGGNVAAALAALGAGIAGRDATSAGQAVLNSQKAARDSKLMNFDKARDLAISDKERATTEEQKLARKDPNSEISKAMQQMAVEDYKMDPATAAKIPAEILETRLPGLKYKMERADKDRELAFKEKESGIKSQLANREQSLKERELAQKGTETALKNNSEKAKFDALPEDKKEIVSGLSKKNAAKIAIANQIDSVLENSKNLSEKDQLQQYRQLIKTLNSSEGADAVGTDEAKRLASKLEFAFGNFSNDNPTQFGRDIKGFAEDAALTSKAMKDAVASNQGVIDKAYGRTVDTTTTETVDVQDPTGKIRKIPKSQLDAALKAGGKLVS